MCNNEDHNNLCDNFKVLATGKSDFDIKIKESLLIQKFKPILNVKSINKCDYTLKLF